ncbi:kinase-like protein [Marasmius fiardii PR-910]|nr:kinase-like protein [Marasmius fiardii PR-910]
MSGSPLDLTGLPLGPAFSLLTTLYQLCNQVSIKRHASLLLHERCERLLQDIQELSPKPSDDLQPAFDRVTICITNAKNRVGKWAGISWIRTIPHLDEIDDDIQKSHWEISDCFRLFQLKASIVEVRMLDEIRRSPGRIAVAAEADDKEIIEKLSNHIKIAQDLSDEKSHINKEKILGQVAMLRDIMAFIQQTMRKLNDSNSNSSYDQFVKLSSTLFEIQIMSNTLPPNLHLTSAEVTDIKQSDVVDPATATNILRGTYLLREPVIVKVVHVAKLVDDRTKKRFLREGQIWERVYRIDHGKYILPFYGFGELEDMRPYMVSPWQEQGNALTYVQKHDKTVNYRKMITDIAHGLRVLHSFLRPPVIHGDLRSANIFINKDGNPLIGDFGLSRIVQDVTNGTFFSQTLPGPDQRLRWYPPEMYDQKIFTASDIYTFGLTVLELMTHKHPFSECPNPVRAGAKVMNGEIPLKPTENKVIERGLDDRLWELLVECWKEDPSARPSIEEVLTRLESSS